jgi:hypothetical protein
MSALYFPAAVWIDSIPLTDQGRSPVSVQREEKFTENELANASKVRYFRGVKRRWSFSWTFLPDSDHQTIDGYAARREIVELLGKDGKDHVLRFYDKDWTYEEYFVFCDSYTEDLIKRDPSGHMFLWEVSVEFCEI